MEKRIQMKNSSTKAEMMLQPNIQIRKNFSNKQIAGTEHVHVHGNVQEHSQDDQHAFVVNVPKKEQDTTEGLGPSANVQHVPLYVLYAHCEGTL